MAGKCLWVALFVTLQVSFALCRSTGQPDEVKTEISVSPGEEYLKPEALKQTVAPGKLDNGDVPIHVAHSSPDADVYRTTVTVVLVIYAIFLILSFMLGCVLYYRSKTRAVRPGHIVSSNTGVQSFGINQPGHFM